MFMSYYLFHGKCLLALSFAQDFLGFLLVLFFVILPPDFHLFMQESLCFDCLKFFV